MRITISKMKIKTLLLFVLLSSFIFQPAIQTILPIFQYLDEVAAIFAFLYFIISLLKNSYLNSKKILLILMIFMLIYIGVLGNILNCMQPYSAIVQDLFTCFKFFFCVLGISTMIRNKQNALFNKLSLDRYIKIVIILLFCLTVLNYFIEIFPVSEYRYGLPVQKLFMEHPTYFVGTLFCLAISLLLTSHRIDRNFIYYELIISLMVLSTLRSKAIGGIVIFWILLFANRYKIKIKTYYIIFTIIIFAILFKNQIIYYFFSSDTFARNALLSKSIEIANDFAPFGGGFASFGTWSSGVYYSPLYYLYSMSDIWGLSPNMYSFVADTFWPAVLGEFGLFGICFMLIALYISYKVLFVDVQLERNKIIALRFIYAYLLISSMAESAFFNPLSIDLIIIFGLLNNQIDSSKKSSMLLNNM